MITLTFDETILSSKDLTPVEKLLSAQECQGMSVKKMAKMLGITERRIFQLRATEKISDEVISDEVISDEMVSDDIRSQVVAVFNRNGINPVKFKNIDPEELMTRIKGYSFDLELDLKHKIKISPEELYKILNNM